MVDKKILKTRVCEMLGIEYPIFLAGMGWTSGPTLAAAVSNAGGLGVLGASNLTPEEARMWIRKTKSLTDKPFGLNLILPPDVASEDAPSDFKELIPKEHLDFVKSIMEELGLPREEVHVPWEDYTYESMQEIGKICIEEEIALFGSGLGNPAWILIPFIPDWRWMLDRDDSIWYPSLRLFRQTSRGDWKSVIKHVLKELEVVVGNLK